MSVAITLLQKVLRLGMSVAITLFQKVLRLGMSVAITLLKNVSRLGMSGAITLLQNVLRLGMSGAITLLQNVLRLGMSVAITLLLNVLRLGMSGAITLLQNVLRLGMSVAITLLQNILMVCRKTTLPVLMFTMDVSTWYGLRLPEADSVRPGSKSGVFSTTLLIRSERIRQVLLLTSSLLCWCELVVIGLFARLFLRKRGIRTAYRIQAVAARAEHYSVQWRFLNKNRIPIENHIKLGQ